ncbi:PDR/VanB family oxidoreductase [Microbacterium sp. RU33B]|uniref:PDR/VanB family oxidoreductase n=1 Tax=Microbacterium sp. RU33B TaxID=1907390 RepID=UPI00096863A4|nr:PDR/VanB family oxidoreductase [Microbacterium sp. RU33B]SIT72266.1 vanillate O-demethylase ferredoxin subunit [Microbacterium sp. RU33B]
MALWRSRRASKGPSSASRDGLQRVRVVEKIPVSDKAVLLRLAAADEGQRLVHYPAGAHLDVHVKPGVVRQYSLVGRPGADDHYLVCVQREPDGRGGSIAVHDEIAGGELLDVSHPRSTFDLVPSARRAVLIGGGIGLTPLMSMAEHLHAESIDFEFHVYAKNPSALPLGERLEARPWTDRIRRHFSDDGDSFRDGSPQALVVPDPDGAVYICGPRGFIDLARDRALAAGWPADRVVVEQFSPASRATAQRPLDVVVASSKERIAVGAEESIADALERHGYETYRSCGQGFCGSCVVRVVAGVPDHRDDFQTPQQHAANTHINVCVSRALTPVLELDV